MKRILVVEDDEGMRSHIRDLVEGLNVMTTISSSWPVAKQLLDGHRYDLIISGMYDNHDIEGRAYRAILRELEQFGPTPVIFLSGHLSPDDAFEAGKLGASDFLLLDRPCTSARLFAAVQAALESGRIPSVFISYASQDRWFAERLAHALSDEGVQVWYDQWELKVGDSIVQTLECGISASRYLVFILSPASVASAWVRYEVDAAFAQQTADQQIKILPALKADCDVPPLLRARKYADFREDFNAGVRDLLHVIKQRPPVPSAER